MNASTYARCLLLSGMDLDCWMQGWWFNRQPASRESLHRGSALKKSFSILSGKSLNIHLDGNEIEIEIKPQPGMFRMTSVCHANMLAEPHHLPYRADRLFTVFPLGLLDRDQGQALPLSLSRALLWLLSRTGLHFGVCCFILSASPSVAPP